MTTLPRSAKFVLWGAVATAMLALTAPVHAAGSAVVSSVGFSVHLGHGDGHHASHGLRHAFGHHGGRHRFGHHPGKHNPRHGLSGRSHRGHGISGRSHRFQSFGHPSGHRSSRFGRTRSGHRGDDCRRVYKDGHHDDRPARIGGTLCYDRHGDPYIVEGSRFVDAYR